MKDILIIDSSETFCVELSSELRNIGYSVHTSFTLKNGLQIATSLPMRLIILNSQMTDGDAIHSIPQFKQMSPAPEIIIISDSVHEEEAESAIKNGAWDYIQKDESARMLGSIVNRQFQLVNHSENKLRHDFSVDKHFDGLVGTSPQFKMCLEIVASAANSDANVLIKGETGTGKELIAWAIHKSSPMASGNFVVVDCAALPETLVESTLLGHERGSFTGADKAQTGLIKQADGGTLFLDEVGELPLSAQKSFLRVLEERRFRPVGGKEEIQSDFRLISATNRDLTERVEKSEFRADLLYRLRSFAIEVPPLRQRSEDITTIVSYHLPIICRRLEREIPEISPEYFESLSRYAWPGNIRELVNSLERSLVASKGERILLPQHLPTYLRVQLVRNSFQPLRSDSHVIAAHASSTSSNSESLLSLQDIRNAAVEKAESDYLRSLMNVSNGDISRACVSAKVSRSRLYSLLKKYNIKF